VQKREVHQRVFRLIRTRKDSDKGELKKQDRRDPNEVLALEVPLRDEGQQNEILRDQQGYCFKSHPALPQMKIRALLFERIVGQHQHQRAQDDA